MSSQSQTQQPHNTHNQLTDQERSLIKDIDKQAKKTPKRKRKSVYFGIYLGY